MIIIHKFSCLKKIIRIAYRDTNVFSHASALIVWEIQKINSHRSTLINIVSIYLSCNFINCNK